MKFTTKLFLTWTSIFLIFYLAVISILALFWGIEIELWQLVLVFTIAGIVPPAFLTMLFYRKLNYMELESSDPPTFEGQLEMLMPFKSRSLNHFNDVFQKIDKGFIVSYSDRDSRVVKFRTDSRVLAWGVCGYVKILDDNTVKAIVYPMNADSKREEIILNQALSLLRTILNP